MPKRKGFEDGFSKDLFEEEEENESLDFGNFDESSDDLEDGEDVFGSSGFDTFDSDDEPEEAEDERSVKKTALIAAGVGLLIIILGLGLMRVVRSGNTGSNGAVIEPNQPSSGNQVVISSPAKVERNDWVNFAPDKNMIFENEIASNFTVIDIFHQAKVINANNDKIIRSVVKGNVSGLVGTYEFEIPYELAVHLKEGSVFEIKYRMTTRNGVKVIGSFEW